MTTPIAPANSDIPLELIFARLSCPFPRVSITGDLSDGLIISQPKICLKCTMRECKGFHVAEPSLGLFHKICPRGLSILVFSFPFGRVVANGIIENFLNTECKSHFKKKLRSQKINFEKAKAWCDSIMSLDKLVGPILETRVNESIQSLHDIGTAVQLVQARANKIIQKHPGKTDEEKIEYADPDLKALFKSVMLLTRHLDMSSIIANPEAASFGQKHPMPVYKVFDLLCRLYQEIAHVRNKHIELNGISHKKPRAYNSFETLALVLIDNAVKYCDGGSSLTIQINDVKDGVKVVVENPGLLVPIEYQGRIFDKGFRTPQAKHQHAAGRGLGLYIAKTIAKAHGFVVQYIALRGGTSDSKKGINSFRFTIPD